MEKVIKVEKKIKIVHLGYMHKYSDTRIFEKECKSLKKLGNVEIYFITSNRGASFEGEELDGIKIKTIPLINKRFVKLAVYIKELKKLTMDLDADVYHIHEHILLPLVKFLKKKGKKVIYDKHEETYDEVFSRAQRLFGKSLGTMMAKKYEKYEERLIRKSDGYIYVTPQHQLNNLNRSLLMPNFPKIEDDNEINQYRNYYPEDEFIISYCGGIAPIWSLSEFSAIAKGIDNIKFQLAGGGGQGYLDKIKEDDHKNVVNLLGTVPFKEVKNIYNNSNLGLALLKKNLGEKLNQEGTLANTKIFEYMQAGLPVIFTDFPIWKKINQEYNFGISVDLENETEIREALEYFMNNPEEAKLMGNNGKRAIKEKYNWENTEKEFLNMYKEVISN